MTDIAVFRVVALALAVCQAAPRLQAESDLEITSVVCSPEPAFAGEQVTCAVAVTDLGPGVAAASATFSLSVALKAEAPPGATLLRVESPQSIAGEYLHNPALIGRPWGGSWEHSAQLEVVNAHGYGSSTAMPRWSTTSPAPRRTSSPCECHPSRPFDFGYPLAGHGHGHGHGHGYGYGYGYGNGALS